MSMRDSASPPRDPSHPEGAKAGDAAGLRALPEPCRGIELWWCDLGERIGWVTQLDPWLSAQEQARAARFGTPELRDRYIAGRTALRYLLGRKLAIAPAAVKLRRGRRGRPELEGEAELDFNVSHTGNIGLIGIANKAPRSLRIGVDLERSDRVVASERLAGKFLCASERARLSDSGSQEHRARFLRYWTFKEAMSKATGDGLIAPFGRLDVDPGAPPRLLDGPAPYAPADWVLHAAQVPDGFFGAVAVWTPQA